MEKLAIHGGRPASESLIGYGRQDVSDEDVQAVVDCLRSDCLTCGPATEAFEESLEEVTGAAFVTAVANGTAALHVACLAAGIGPGDEVIVSSITFAASANCVRYCGGTPVFADIDPATWNIDPASIREKVTARTKAVVAVDFGGVPVNHEAIRAICDEFGLVFIEDAAHAIGTRTADGRAVGSIADVTCFSFHPVKTVTTGEGGAVATSDPKLAEMVELYARHGITRRSELLREKDVGGWHYEQLALGYNYRISDIEASLGTSQLKRLGEFAARRRELVAFYNREFSKIPEVSYQIDAAPDETVRHLYCLKFDCAALGVDRRFVYDALRAENIGVNVHYLPVHLLPYYRDLGHSRGECPNAEAYYDDAVTLPLHCRMSDEDARHVVDAVVKVVEWCRANKAGRR